MRLIKDPALFIDRLPPTALPQFLESFQNYFDYGYFYCDDCILPFVVRKKFFFKYMQLTSPIIGFLDHRSEQEFLNKVISTTKSELKIDFIMSSNLSIFNSFPNSSLFCKFGSYIIDLTKTEEDLFRGLHTKHRNVIRKAQSDGLEVYSGSIYSKDCYDLISQTYHRQGLLPPSLNSFNNLIQNKDVEIWVVKNDQKIEGTAVLLWNIGGTCLYYHGGSSNNPHSGSSNLLHWEAIKKMKARGVLRYDFVGGRVNPDKGSKLEGIQRFKSRFGGDFQVGYLWKFIFNPFKYKVYSILLYVYFRLIRQESYEGDVIDQERRKGNF